MSRKSAFLMVVAFFLMSAVPLGAVSCVKEKIVEVTRVVEVQVTSTFTPSPLPSLMDTPETAQNSMAVIASGSTDLPPVIEYPEEGDVFLVRRGKTKLKIQVKAYDPEGKPLRYSLNSGPAELYGVKFNSDTGLITWDVPIYAKIGNSLEPVGYGRRFTLQVGAFDRIPFSDGSKFTVRTFFIDVDG
ncbi:MAG: hypothetical protein HYW97_00130 [Candidatus Wildermuthbacteria bacterium]|nr:hypothetical protein [Candidatus Wildermuthbacteria bacterium]